MRVDGPADRALSDLLEQGSGGATYAVRDFALLSIASHLSARFPGQLVFKGGFVLRQRFSDDIDATRRAPPTSPQKPPRSPHKG